MGRGVKGGEGMAERWVKMKGKEREELSLRKEVTGEESIPESVDTRMESFKRRRY